jgi:hypothetical protein
VEPSKYKLTTDFGQSVLASGCRLSLLILICAWFLIKLISESRLRCQTTLDVNFEFYLDEVRLIGHAAWLHVVCTYGKWISICWLSSLKTLGGATGRAAKPSSLVFMVALILGSGQVDAAKDLWERNLGAIV